MLDHFESAIAPFGFKQNTGKANSLLRLHGEGSRTSLHNTQRIEGINAKVSARYLGPQLHWQNRASIEVGIRIKQAWSAFHMYKKLWFSGVNLKFKVCVFKATVLSSLCSAIVVFVLTKTEFKRLHWVNSSISAIPGSHRPNSVKTANACPETHLAKEQVASETCKSQKTYKRIPEALRGIQGKES